MIEMEKKSMFRILIAEEDAEVRNALVSILQEHGYKAIGVSDGEQALQIIGREYINLILSNVMLSDVDEEMLSQKIKENNYEIPLLLFKSHNVNQHERLRFLADAQDILDYRDANAILNRLQQILSTRSPLGSGQITFGDITVELKDMYVQIGENHFLLNKEEYLLMCKFIFFPNKIFTKIQLQEGIAEELGTIDTDLFEQYMIRIREIIRHSEEVEMEHIHGLGYKVVKKVVS